MKTMNLVRTLLMAVGMASCTAVSDAPVNHEESTSTLEKNFNARSVNYRAGDKNSPNLSELTPVSEDEANSILNTLRSHRNVKVSHAVAAQGVQDAVGFVFTDGCQFGKIRAVLVARMVVHTSRIEVFFQC